MPKPFKPTAIKFLNKIIRVRKHLIKNNKSKLNDELALNYINTIESFTGLRATSNSLASVFIHHHDKIIYLIPGKHASNHIKLLTEFYELRAQAIQIKNNIACKA